MDTSRLFKDVEEKEYNYWYKLLVKYRKLYPAYRDDQLLMYMLCTEPRR